MKHMKLLVNCAFVGEEPVGITRYIQRLLPPLAHLCNVTLLTSNPKLFKEADCKVVEIPEWTRPHLGRFWWEMTLLPFQIRQYYDVLLCPTPEVPPCRGIPAVAIVHDLTPLVVRRTHSSRYKTFFWLSLQTLRWADAVVAVSEHTKSDINRLQIVPPQRVHIVPEGPGLLPTPEKSSFAQRFCPYILYVGGHPPHKNVVRLVTAFSRLKSPDNVKLVIAGWGTRGQIATTKEAVRQCGVSDRTVLLADLSDAQLSSLYQKCLAFVFPSLYEGFGLPVLEALAHGAPVACASTSSIPEVAGEAAVYFNPVSVNDIAEKLHLIIENRTLAQELRQRGPRQVRQFSWEEAARRIYCIARSLTTGRR